MSDISQDKKPPSAKSSAMKSGETLSNPQAEPSIARSDEKRRIKEEELKEGINTENIGAFKEDLLVGDRANVDIKKRKEYSKYDFIKVRVTLGEHFYVFSRFLVSRMLTLCKIPHLDAVKIAKDVKKHLIEANKLDIPQEEVNDTLFEFMNAYNYGEQYINRYKMISKFYQKRTPMIILISGTVGIAKSIIATHLAERMNISNVLQTDIVESVMTKMYPELFKENLKTQDFNSKEEFIQEYQKRCKVVRRGANTDIHKCLVEGKPLIIEGFTLDPSLYLQFQNNDNNPEITQEEITQRLEDLERLGSGSISAQTKEEKLKRFNSTSHAGDRLRFVTYQYPDVPVTEREKVLKKEMDKAEQKSAVIVPILLVLNKRDHFYCVENKIDSLKAFDGLPYQEKKKKINSCLENYGAIQEYLLKSSSLCTVVPISINNLEGTLELLQDIIIEKIEADYENWAT